MTDDLLSYYNRELGFIRRMGAEFARTYPKIAGRLRFDEGMIEDPHVSRLVESFAFLTARLRRKIDDDLPELTDALLGQLYPHYTRPVPSMAIVQFDAKSDLTTVQTLPRGTEIETQSVEGEPCRFRTCFETPLIPARVVTAGISSAPLVAPEVRGVPGVRAAFRLALSTASDQTAFEELAPQKLRIHLKGQEQHVFELYEHLAAGVLEVAIARSPDDPNPRLLGPDALVQVGFGRGEGILPYPAQSFRGYRLLTEFFCFPRKFLFLDVCGLDADVLSGFTDRLEVFIYLDRASSDLERNVTADSVALGCTPVVNLFAQQAEPIDLDHHQPEYRVVPDARRQRANEVYSVDSVVAVTQDGDEDEYLPFHGVRHGLDADGRTRFWCTARQPAGVVDGDEDPGTEVFVSVVDLDFSPNAPDDSVLRLETTCLNRDLPGRLPFGGGQPYLQLAHGGPPVQSITCLTPPTPTLRPEMGHGAFWRLLSHLSLNHLSLTGDEGADALKEILRLYDFRDSPETRRMIEGLLRVTTRVAAARSPGVLGGVCRGTEVTLELDRERFTGSGVFLFASVLERFLALYGSINAFTTTVVTLKGREGEFHRWAPRAGDRVLL